MLHTLSADGESVQKLCKTGSILSPGATLMGAAAVGVPSYQIASGDASVGGALGETLGGFGGFIAGEKLFNALAPGNPISNAKFRYAVDDALAKANLYTPAAGKHSLLGRALTHSASRTIGRMAAGFLLSSLLTEPAKAVGEQIMPWRLKKPGSAQDNAPETATYGYEPKRPEPQSFDELYAAKQPDFL